MINVLLVGSNGTMGKQVVSELENNQEFHLVAGVESLFKQQPATNYPIYERIKDVSNIADIVIDFSHPSLLSDILSYGMTTNTPLVLCTTGYTKKDIESMEQASKKIPIFHSANMSMGVNLLIELVKLSAAFLGEEFDIEIIEKHHNKKIDAPSGTALLLAQEINKSQNNRFNYCFGRSETEQKRNPNEIGIHAVRGGNIVGEHHILFAGEDETLTISHSAFSKKIFVKGALKAALFLIDKSNGLYTMEDLVKNKT